MLSISLRPIVVLTLVIPLLTACGGSSQPTDKLNVEALIHFNTNVSDFEQSRAFYGALGFETLSGFPDTNTLAMAQAIGIDTPTEYDGSQGASAGGYLLHGELIGVGGNAGGLIDLIEFTIPRNDEPPYPSMNHLGMVSAAMYTTNLDADYQHLSTQGVEFLSPPVIDAQGTKFAMFKDPDGTFYELVELADDSIDDAQNPGKTHIYSLGYVTINVSNFERSAKWYGLFGFELSHMLAEQENDQVGQALGFPGPVHRKAGVFKHPLDGSQLKIVEWIEPYLETNPYPVPINHFGIHRIAFTSTDIEADVALLKTHGVEFVSDITPCCSGEDSWGGIVAFYDPDGTIVELADQPLMNFMMSVMRWFS